MTLFLDPDTGDVRESDGTLIGTVEGPPYQLPDDAMAAVKQSFPSDHASVSVDDLLRTLDAAGGDVKYGTPPQSDVQ